MKAIGAEIGLRSRRAEMVAYPTESKAKARIAEDSTREIFHE
jgi:hypothetical protein